MYTNIGFLTARSKFLCAQNLHKNGLNNAKNRKTTTKGIFVSITYYWARHTVGNLARNKCRMSKDDVALTLNHVDHGRKTTDIYVDKDWSIVDDLQKMVIKLLIKEKEVTKI